MEEIMPASVALQPIVQMDLVNIILQMHNLWKVLIITGLKWSKEMVFIQIQL